MKSLLPKLKELWWKVIRQNATPNEIAAGFAIGLFSTFYPVPVVDTLVALAVARLARVNAAACLVGNSFVLVVFPLIPVMIAAEVAVGRLLVDAPTLAPPGDLPMTTWLLRQTGPNLKAFALGGLILGIPSSLLSYWGVRKAAAKWQARASSSPAA